MLQSVMMAYRTSPATQSTRCTPYSLLFGQECRLPIDVSLLPPDKVSATPHEHLHTIKQKIDTYSKFAQENIAAAQQSSKIRYDKKATVPSFETGTLVLLRNNHATVGRSSKLEPKWLGPYYIADKSTNTYLLRERHTHKLLRNRVHADRLRHYKDQNIREPMPTPSLTLQQPNQNQTPQVQIQNDLPTPPDIEGVFKCKRTNGITWYYVKIRDQRQRQWVQQPLGLKIAGTVGRDSPCPLGKVLTYKNLIYLLNFPFYCVNTSYLVDRCRITTQWKEGSQ